MLCYSTYVYVEYETAKQQDGRRAGPIDRGPCHNFLKDVATFVKENFISGTDSVNLNMIALAAPE